MFKYKLKWVNENENEKLKTNLSVKTEIHKGDLINLNGALYIVANKVYVLSETAEGYMECECILHIQ